MNSDLIQQLRKQHNDGLQVSMAIDHFRICTQGELQEILELDRWFGAPFRFAQIDDPQSKDFDTPVLLYRPKDLGPGEPEGLRTEFRWSLKKDQSIRSLEIEELPNPDKLPSNRSVLCRFIHCQRDIANSRFVHLDGAVTIYDFEQYKSRYSQSVDHTLSKVWANQKPKVFRVDATEDPKSQITYDSWSQLITSFFRGNELVLEYLTGKNFADIYREEYGHDHPWLLKPSHR